MRRQVEQQQGPRSLRRLVRFVRGDGAPARCMRPLRRGHGQQKAQTSLQHVGQVCGGRGCREGRHAQEPGEDDPKRRLQGVYVMGVARRRQA